MLSIITYGLKLFLFQIQLKRVSLMRFTADIMTKTASFSGRLTAHNRDAEKRKRKEKKQTLRR